MVGGRLMIEPGALETRGPATNDGVRTVNRASARHVMRTAAAVLLGVAVAAAPAHFGGIGGAHYSVAPHFAPGGGYHPGFAAPHGIVAGSHFVGPGGFHA